MSAADLRKAVDQAIAYAAKENTSDIGLRARVFIAALSGSIQLADPEFSDAIFAVLGSTPAAPVSAEASAVTAA